jgi:hypothetical protein
MLRSVRTLKRGKDVDTHKVVCFYGSYFHDLFCSSFSRNDLHQIKSETDAEDESSRLCNASCALGCNTCLLSFKSITPPMAVFIYTKKSPAVAEGFLKFIFYFAPPTCASVWTA